MTTAPADAALVVTAAPAYTAEARRAAASLALPFAADPSGAGLALLLDSRGWALVDPAAPRQGAVRADFVHGPLGDRLRRGVDRRDRLVKAMAIGNAAEARVLDATAGLGRDSAVAAAIGCTVTACERSPVVALLLGDALARATADPAIGPIAARIHLEPRDARDVLAALEERDRPDVVLIDPMFPERGKSALAKKEMQLLLRLLGPEPDVEALLVAALASARQRVIVKRPLHAHPAAGRRPSHSLEGRAARLDVYVVT